MVRSIYYGLKQIAETVFAQSETQFRKGLPGRIPAQGHLGDRLHLDHRQGRDRRPSIPVDEQMMSIFLPTTPNPTSGFLLFVPKTRRDRTGHDASRTPPSW